MKADYSKRFGMATNIYDCEYRSICLARSEINMAYRNAKRMKDNTLVFYDPQNGEYWSISNIMQYSHDEIVSNITEDGRYYIGFDGMETNHALNAYRVKGKLYIYDQQINGSYDLLTLLKEAEATSIEVLRLDNILFDATYIDHWIKAR